MSNDMQDFAQRLIIVVRKDIENWQTKNAIAHISAFIGNKLGTGFSTGDVFITKDGGTYPRNSQYPIIVKRANSNEQLRDLLVKVRESKLLHLPFVREMLEHSDDIELQKALFMKGDAEVEILGIGIFGPNEEVAALTKKFGLWE